MAELRALALTVPATLMQVGASEEALRLIDVAVSKLAMRAEVVRRVRAGYFMPMDIDIPDPLPEGVCPTEILRDALHEMTRQRALLAGAVFVFLLYGKQTGQAADPLFQSWDRRRLDALHHANEALRRLRSALSCAVAFKDAIRVSYGPQWDAWMLAAHGLARAAVWEANEALLDVRQMRHAVAMEHSDAWMILDR